MVSVLLIAVAITCLTLAATGFNHRRIHPTRRPPFEELICTKHMIIRSRIPGGPDHRAWVYGKHRTPGNACDGGIHRRKGGWW